MSKTVKQKLTTIISSLSSTQFVEFFQQYLKTFKGTNIVFEKQIQFMDLHKYQAHCKLAGISAKGSAKNPSQAMINAMKKLVSKLVQVGNFTDIFLMCLKRKNKHKVQKRQIILTQQCQDSIKLKEKTYKEKQKQQLYKIRNKIQQLHLKLKKQRQINIQLKKKQKKMLIQNRPEEKRLLMIQKNDRINNQQVNEKIEKKKVKRFRTQLSEIKLNSNYFSCSEEQQNSSKIKLKTQANECIIPKKLNIPKLNLRVLDNYHQKNQTSLNQQLLRKYIRNHS